MPLYSHLGLAISRPFPLLFVLSISFLFCVWRLVVLSWKTKLDTISLLTEDGEGHYMSLKIRCYVAHEDHASDIISQIAKSLLIFQTIQFFAQVILISQKRWARTAKTLSILLISATLACVIAIAIKARNFMKVLEGPGPFPEWEEDCSESRAKLSRYYDIRNISDDSGVGPVVIVCAVDCALKLFRILFLFVLPTSIKIPVPFEPIVTGLKAQSQVESDVNFPEMGPVSEAWKNARRRSLSRDHTCSTTISVQNNACPSWVLSKRLTRMPVVASESPCFSPQIQHWTQDRYRPLRHVIPILSSAVLLDFISLFVSFYAPNSNARQCTSLCQFRIASICWKLTVLLASLLIVIKQIDLQKYNLWHVTLWHIVVLLWCIVPFSFPGPLIASVLHGMLFAASTSLSFFWTLYVILSGKLGLVLTVYLLAVASPSFRALASI